MLQLALEAVFLALSGRRGVAGGDFASGVLKWVSPKRKAGSPSSKHQLWEIHHHFWDNFLGKYTIIFFKGPRFFFQTLGGGLCGLVFLVSVLLRGLFTWKSQMRFGELLGVDFKRSLIGNPRKITSL